MEVCITTDYHVDEAVPRALQIERMKAAGFDWCHWCYDWCHDVTYGEEGLATARGWLEAAGLKLLDLHGDEWGEAKHWHESAERRDKALALQSDRIRFTSGLGGDAVVIHPPSAEPLDEAIERYERSIEAMTPLLRETGVRLAVENIPTVGVNQPTLRACLADFPPELVGFCLDSGHANITGELDWLQDHCFDRLIALHLHDNDGTGDQHRLPGQGTIDWARLSAAIRDAGYAKPVNFELSMTRSGYTDEQLFLNAAYDAAMRLFGGL